jgi:hypothetical protein
MRLHPDASIEECWEYISELERSVDMREGEVIALEKTIKDLLEQIATCRELRGYDRKDIDALRTENRFLSEMIQNDALLVERYNAFNERRKKAAKQPKE